MDDKELKDVLYNRLQANGVDVSRNPIAGTAASIKTGAVEGTKQAVNNAASFVKTDLTNTEYAKLNQAKKAAESNVDYDSFMDRMADKYGFKVRILKQSIMDDADKEMYFSAAAAKDLGINNIDDWNRINNEYNTKLGNIESERSAKQQESIAKQQETDRKYMLGTVGEFAQDLGSAAGNMAPSLGLGLINPALGLASFGTQAAAQSYGQALDEGATHEQATRYGVATGLKEAAIERLTGGLSRFYGKGILDNVIGVQPNNTLRNVILNTAKGAAGEGAEEALSGAIDPFLQRATYNPEVENADIGDLAYQAAIGAALGGILGGGSNVVDYGVSRNANRTQQNAAQQAQTQERTNATTAGNDQLKGVVEQPTMGENQGVGVNVSENMGVSEPQRTFTAEQQQQTVPNVENVETRNVNNEPYAQAMENIMNEPTKEQQELKRFVEIAANNANMSVKYEDMPASQRSYYSDGVIHINRNLPIDKTIKTTTAHEIYHGLEGTKEHDKIIELALKNMGIDETTAIAQKKAQYKNDANIDLDDVGARAEIGAEFIEKAMSDEATINTVLTESPSLARRILQKIKDMIDVFKKRKTMTPREREQYSSLLKARQLYESGIAKLSSGKYEPAETGGRYAISNQATQQTATKPKNGVGYRFFDNTFQKSETFDDAVKEIERTYEHEREKRVSEKETLEEARKRLQDDWKKEFETVLKKNSLSGADTDVAMGIIGELNNYEPGTDGFERIMKFAEEYADKTVESGQFIQALAKYTRTPMGKTQKAMRDVKREERKLQEENPKKWNEAQKVISKVKEQVKQAETDATEETINVVSKNTVNEIEKKAKKTKKTQNKGENQDDAEILAEKISWHVDEPNADSTENARLQKDIINELYRLAKESPLPDKAINVQKTDYVQLLNEIIHNRSKYENVWDRAREIVGAKYKDDPEKMKVLEDFFNNYTVPIYSKASMEKAISAELEKMQTNIAEIIKQNKDDRKATIEQVKKLLSEDLNLDILDAQTKDIVANDIVNTLESKIKKELSKKMDKFLDDTVKEKAKNEPLKKQILRMIKNNEFNEDETARVIKKAYDIPTLTSEETRQIMNYYEKANEYEEGSYNYRKWESKANQIIDQKTPKSLYDKNKAYRRIMMLLNPATMERNIFGNVIYGVAELAKNIPAGLVDIAVSKKTGQRTTSANVVADIRAFLDGASKGTREWAQDIKYGVDTSYNTVREEYQTQGGFTFDNKKVLGKALNKAEYIMSKGLQLGDRPFYEGAYSQRLNELKRLGYDTKNKEVQLGAHIYALERVYQNDSAISKALVGVRDKLGLFGHFLIPFAQTPGNILDKTIDYSGVGGLARALWQLGTAKNTGNFDQKLFVDRIGRALTGTGIMALGAALYETGNLLGSDDDDYLVANAKRLAGEKEYAIKIGENYYTIDWAQPVSALLVAGAEAVKAGLEQDDLMQIGIAAGEGVINTLFAMSCLESLSSLTSSYGEANAAEKISGVFIDGISQYFPTSLRRLNNVIDPYQRQTYDPNTIKKQAKYIISGIPLLSYLLEPKYTLEGEVQLKSQGRGTASRIMENFLVPYNKSEEYHSPVNDELIRLYESTGKTSQLLRFADKKLDLGDSGTYVLNTKEYNEMQKEIGKNTATAYSDLMRNSVYKSMDDFEKVEALSDIANFYENQYKSNYAKKNGLNYENSTYAKTKERIDKVGGWKNYFEVKQAFPDATFDTALKYKEKCDQYNIDYEAYADAKTSISDLRDANSERYTDSGQKTEANRRDTAKYLSNLSNLSDPQRQVIWSEIYTGKTSETYKSVANRYGY